jgi:hypothetical protein
MSAGTSPKAVSADRAVVTADPTLRKVKAVGLSDLALGIQGRLGWSSQHSLKKRIHGTTYLTWAGGWVA